MGRKRKYIQGQYNLLNPQKYKGNIHKITYRSSWELIAFQICDKSDNILMWSSEEIKLKYYDSIKRKNRTYYVDLYVKFSNFQEYLFEIKPAYKLIKSKCKNINEHINIMEKATAAKTFCYMANAKGSNIKFAFLSIVNNSFKIINF